MIDEYDLAELFKNNNTIKNNTLDIIPSNFKEILLASVDPRYYNVSILNRHYQVALLSDDAKMKVQLNRDGLIQSTHTKLEYDNKTISVSYSYDYVQDHFSEIINPIESGIYKISK